MTFFIFSDMKKILTKMKIRFFLNSEFASVLQSSLTETGTS